MEKCQNKANFPAWFKYGSQQFLHDLQVIAYWLFCPLLYSAFICEICGPEQHSDFLSADFADERRWRESQRRSVAWFDWRIQQSLRSRSVGAPPSAGLRTPSRPNQTRDH